MISPRPAGDASTWHNVTTVDGGAAYSLAGLANANVTMHFINLANGTLRIATGANGTGGCNITDGTNGKFDFAPSAADVATPGSYRVYPVVQLSTGPRAMDPQTVDLQ